MLSLESFSNSEIFDFNPLIGDRMLEKSIEKKLDGVKLKRIQSLKDQRGFRSFDATISAYTNKHYYEKGLRFNIERNSKKESIVKSIQRSISKNSNHNTSIDRYDNQNTSKNSITLTEGKTFY